MMIRSRAQLAQRCLEYRLSGLFFALLKPPKVGTLNACSFGRRFREYRLYSGLGCASKKPNESWYSTISSPLIAYTAARCGDAYRVLVRSHLHFT